MEFHSAQVGYQEDNMLRAKAEDDFIRCISEHGYQRCGPLSMKNTGQSFE